MDIFCVGMLRSCSTWQYEVASHLVERRGKGKRIGYLEGPDYLAQPAPVPGLWRVLKAHHRHEAFARQIELGNARPIYSYRDLRDVVFSMAHKFGLSFEQIHATGRVQQLLDDDAFWRSCPGVLIQRYENIVSQPVSCVRQIADFLDISLDLQEAGKIASEYSFESNLKRTHQLTRRLRREGVDLSLANNLLRHDPNTLLHWNHLRTGKVGAWRDQATIEQRRLLAEWFHPWLEKHGYELDPLDENPAEQAGSTALSNLGQQWSDLARRATALTTEDNDRPSSNHSLPAKLPSMNESHPGESGPVAHLQRRVSRWFSSILVSLRT
jgi:hypothetical protein